MLEQPDMLGEGAITRAKLFGEETYESYLRLIEILEKKGADFNLEREIMRVCVSDLARMNIDLGRQIQAEQARLRQQRHEIYERIQQQIWQREEQQVVQ